MKLRLIYLIFTLLICSCHESGRSISSIEVKDVVFDLDWTLIKQLKRGEDLNGPNILRYKNESYRLNDGVIELLTYLSSRDDVRVSFFSGGDKQRNLKVLEQIVVGNKSAKDLAYKILSKNDLEVISTDESLKFTDKYKKNLLMVNKNLKNVLIIDDDIRFSSNEAQKKNFLWLESVKYHFESSREIFSGKGEFDPRSKHEWFFDRNKIYMVHLILESSLDEDDFLVKVKEESSKWNFKDNKFRPSQAGRFIRQFDSNECSDLMFKFIIEF